MGLDSYGLKDKTPVGKRGNLYLYQTPSGQLVGTTEEPTTSGGISYANLTRKSRGSSGTTGTPYTPQQLEAQRLERIRKQAELLKQQAEAKKLREQLERARKEKIESGKISGQVSGKVNGQVTSRFQTLSTAGNPLSDPYYRTSAYGKKVAEYNKASFAEASKQGRNLGLGEKESIAGMVFGGGGSEIERSKSILQQGLLTEAEEKQRLEYEIRKIQRKDEGKPLYTDEELKVLQAGENIKTLGGDTISPGLTGEANIKPKQSIFEKSDSVLTKGTDFIFGGIKKVTGVDITTPEGQNILSQSSLGVGSFGLKPQPKQDIISGATAGVLKDIKEKPTKNILIYGASAGLGFGVSAISSGVASVSPVAGGLIKGTSTLGGLGLGGAYVYSVGKDVLASKDLSSAGAKLGVATKDVLLFGYGYKTGAKGFDITKGYLATRGRKFIDIPQGEYPTAPSKKQLKLFQKNVYAELGEKPGAFHTTSQTFWKGGKITPTTGASELPGIYGSTQVSTPFSRIQGSGATTPKFNIKNTFKNLFAPIGKPGVAYLQPKGFRNVQVRFSQTKQFEGQQLIKGRGYAYFKTPLKKGYADLPGVKSEIESVFRVGAGDYSLSGQGYYTKIKGVRVPIDTFIYSGKGSSAILNAPIKNVAFKPSSYNLPVTSRAYLPPSFIPSGYSTTYLKSSNVLGSSSVISRASSRSYYKSSAKLPYSSLVSSGKSTGYSYAPPTSRISYGSSLSSSSSSSIIRGSSILYPKSSSKYPPKSPPGLLYKSLPLKMKSKRKTQILKQRTKYQISFTGASLGLKGTGRAPGGLSVRGFLTPQQIKARYPKKPKKIKRLRKDKKRDMLKDMFDL